MRKWRDRAHHDEMLRLLPRPTPRFRRQAWREFQRALDPLARPRPMPPARR